MSVASGQAVVHAPDGRPGEETIIELSHLPFWHLQAGAGSGTAALMSAGQARLQIHRVRIFAVSRRSRLVGYVTNADSGLPMSGIIVRNRTTGERSSTGMLGAYDLEARPGLNELELIGPNLTNAQGQRVPFTAAEGLVRHDLAVRRSPPALGDGIERVVLTHRNVGPFCVRQGHFIIAESAGTEVTLLWEIPRAGGQGTEIGRIRGCSGLIAVGDRLYVVDTYDKSYLFEVQSDGGTSQGPRLPTLWPAGITHDGTNFWIAQRDRSHGGGYALWRWNPATGLTNKIACDSPVTSPAWLNGRLWLLVDGVACEIDPQKALDKGEVRLAVLRTFATQCGPLASDGTNLWAMGPTETTLHRLYVQ